MYLFPVPRAWYQSNTRPIPIVSQDRLGQRWPGLCWGGNGYVVIAQGPGCYPGGIGLDSCFRWPGREVALGQNRYRLEQMDYTHGRHFAMLMNKCMTRHGVLGANRGQLKVTAGGIYALRDEQGEGRVEQDLHYDWHPSKWEENDDDLQPLSCIWAATEDFKLVVEVGGQRKAVCVPAGGMVILRGDLYHGGWGYLGSGLRIHGYVCRPGVAVPQAVYPRSQ